MGKNNRKSVLGSLGAIMLMVIRDAALGAAISALFCLFKWIGSMVPLCGAPTWSNFLGGGVGISAFLFLLDMFSTTRYAVRCKRDPVFKEMSERTGIEWKDYQRLKAKREEKEELDSKGNSSITHLDSGISSENGFIPVSKMEVGTEFPIRWDNIEVVARVEYKDADGRSVVSVYDAEENILEAGIDDMRDEQWDALRVKNV